MLLCCDASAQISYDGYESLVYEFTFEYAGERVGEFKLLFYASDHQHGHVVREWIRPGSHFFGFLVTFEEKKGRQEVLFKSLDPSISGFRIPIGHTVHSSTKRGTFIREGRGDEIVTAYDGDTFTLGGTTVTVHSLSRTEAKLQISNTGSTSTLIISDTGALRSQLNSFHEELFRLQTEVRLLRRDQRNFRYLLFYFAEQGFLLLASYVLVYVCIFIGLHQLRLRPKLLKKHVSRDDF